MANNLVKFAARSCTCLDTQANKQMQKKLKNWLFKNKDCSEWYFTHKFKTLWDSKAILILCEPETLSIFQLQDQAFRVF